MIAMAEKEAEHRHWLDRSFVPYRFTALVGAFILSTVVIVGGIVPGRKFQ